MSARTIGEDIRLRTGITGPNARYSGKTAKIISISSIADEPLCRVELWAGHSRRQALIIEADIA